jgi:hypothetical protein
MSGYSNATGELDRTLEPDTAFLQKPFALGDLAAKVRDLLDASATDAPLIAA